MKNIRIYQTGSYRVGESLELSPQAGLHLALVLRMRVGDPLILFSGENQEFQATIASIHKKTVVVTISSQKIISRESPCKIALAQGISKGERMEFVVQKAVELGVHEIYPILTARSVVRMDAERFEKKQAQWQAIAISACEQSGRNYVPEIKPVGTVEQFLQSFDAELKLLLDPKSDKNWRGLEKEARHVALLIGPEGGLTDEEVQLAREKQFETLSLGPRILRTETAAITALSLLQGMFGDL